MGTLVAGRTRVLVLAAEAVPLDDAVALRTKAAEDKIKPRMGGGRYARGRCGDGDEITWNEGLGESDHEAPS
jgi:hypothetical protein